MSAPAGQIPSARVAVFATAAAATKTSRVVVVVRSETIADQYRAAVRAAGGNVDNLVFKHIDKLLKEVIT
jgi:hypothetical protein